VQLTIKLTVLLPSNPNIHTAAMSQSNPFALDTVRFLGGKTTDSDPFGDRDLVQSNPDASMRMQRQRSQQYAGDVGMATLHNEMLRQEARKILQDDDVIQADQLRQQKNTSAAKSAYSDTRLLSSVKSALLNDTNPANLINVLLFWINFQVSRGTPNHNQCVLNVLQDMKSVFVASKKPEDNLIIELQAILNTVVDNLHNNDYDSTEAVVDFVEKVGVFFMKRYLLQRGVILADIEAFDMLTTWIYFQYIMKRHTFTKNANMQHRDSTPEEQAQQLLDCMKMLERQVDVPMV